MTYCACQCGVNLTLLKRAGRLRRHARYASAACRVRGHRACAREAEKALHDRSLACRNRVVLESQSRVRLYTCDPGRPRTRNSRPFCSSLSEKNITPGGELLTDPTFDSTPRSKGEVDHATNLCDRCEELAERIASLEATAQDLQTQNNDLASDRALADRECRRLRREAALLRAELTQAREEDPKSKVIRDILEHWKQETGHQRCLTPLDGDRASKVRRALKWGFKPAKLKTAIDGAARYPYVVDYKRSATGEKDARYDDLETIFKSERQIELLAKLADADTPAPAIRPAVKVSNLQPGEQPIDAFLSRLDQPKPTGLNQWEARCPAHEDRHASLSVAQGNRGVVAHCHAGCAIENIARAIGLEVTDLFDPEPATAPAPANPVLEPLQIETAVGRWREWLAAHELLLGRLHELRGWTPATLERLEIGFDGERLTLPVRDKHGQLQNVLRYLPVRRGTERKLLAMKGRPRDLFPAPETLTGDEFWLFEGEPDAITGHELGLQATALPGVNGWRVEWARRFTDVRVIVCLDADEAGRKAAQRVLPSLLDHAREVRAVDLAPDRTDGFDVSDFVRDGGKAGDLLRLALSAGAVVRLGDVAA